MMHPDQKAIVDEAMKKHDAKPMLTEDQLLSVIERLDLHVGDVLIVGDHRLTPRITAVRDRRLNFPLPIIVAQEGYLTKMNIEDLRKVVLEYDDWIKPEVTPNPERTTSSAPNPHGW